MNIQTARDLAHAIRAEVRPDLTARPWQKQAPEETLWWLVPSTEWPAYRHGKLLFSLAKDGPRRALLGLQDQVLEVDKIFAGLNIEKGYGSVAINVDPALTRRTDQIMDSGWLWHRLMGDAGAARFAEMLSAASARCNLHLYVVSSYAHDRQVDRGDRDAIVFSCRPQGLELVLRNELPVNVLRECKKVADFPSLTGCLRKIDDFHWVDIYVGTYVAKGENDVGKLYRDTLSHFDPWVVESPRDRARS
jgi:hypothetical protein